MAPRKNWIRSPSETYVKINQNLASAVNVTCHEKDVGPDTRLCSSELSLRRCGKPNSVMTAARELGYWCRGVDSVARES
jgi:hypothetical protein